MADVKICGIRTPADLKAAHTAGAKWVGLVFFERSPRHLDSEAAAGLRRAADEMPERPSIVALSVDADDATLEQIIAAAAPDMLQCHGSESPERVGEIKRLYGLPVIKALAVRDQASLEQASTYEGCADYLLFDAPPNAKLPNAKLPGGTGHAFDWQLLADWHSQTPQIEETPWMLAGGLTPENVAEAIAISGAKAVDVSSGVEKARPIKEAGIKDHAAIVRFISAAR